MRELTTIFLLEKIGLFMYSVAGFFLKQKLSPFWLHNFHWWKEGKWGITWPVFYNSLSLLSSYSFFLTFSPDTIIFFLRGWLTTIVCSSTPVYYTTVPVRKAKLRQNNDFISWQLKMAGNSNYLTILPPKKGCAVVASLSINSQLKMAGNSNYLTILPPKKGVCSSGRPT